MGKGSRRKGHCGLKSPEEGNVGVFEGDERTSGDWSLVNEKERSRRRDKDGKMSRPHVTRAPDSHGKESGLYGVSAMKSFQRSWSRRVGWSDFGCKEITIAALWRRNWREHNGKRGTNLEAVAVQVGLSVAWVPVLTEKVEKMGKYEKYSTYQNLKWT